MKKIISLICLFIGLISIKVDAQILENPELAPYFTMQENLVNKGYSYQEASELAELYHFGQPKQNSLLTGCSYYQITIWSCEVKKIKLCNDVYVDGNLWLNDGCYETEYPVPSRILVDQECWEVLTGGIFPTCFYQCPEGKTLYAKACCDEGCYYMDMDSTPLLSSSNPTICNNVLNCEEFEGLNECVYEKSFDCDNWICLDAYFVTPMAYAIPTTIGCNTNLIPVSCDNTVTIGLTITDPITTTETTLTDLGDCEQFIEDVFSNNQDDLCWSVICPIGEYPMVIDTIPSFSITSCSPFTLSEGTEKILNELFIKHWYDLYYGTSPNPCP